LRYIPDPFDMFAIIAFIHLIFHFARCLAFIYFPMLFFSIIRIFDACNAFDIIIALIFDISRLDYCLSLFIRCHYIISILLIIIDFHFIIDIARSASHFDIASLFYAIFHIARLLLFFIRYFSFYFIFPSPFLSFRCRPPIPFSSTFARFSCRLRYRLPRRHPGYRCCW